MTAPSPTLFLPRGAPKTRDSRTGWTLSPELQAQVTRRLQWVAILYSLAFFFADLFPSIVTGEMPMRVAMSYEWVISVVAVLGGFAVALLARSSRIGWQTKLDLGLVFLVVSCYGIALSSYVSLPPFVAESPMILHALSPSWVGIWMVTYSTVVPAPPGRTLIALILAASAPAVVIGLVLRNAHLSHLLPPAQMFFSHVFPYLIVIGLAYAGTRVVYRLGVDVSRARELGSYHLVERLGQGGMGEVWRATHQMLARPAAIKFIHPAAVAGVTAGESQTMLKRFELEARSTASLSSAHTIELYDFGVTDDGTFYYVMELLDGLDCDRLVQRFGPLEPARVVHLLLQVCESLEEAHDKGLIHRDVKPANIYVCRSGNQRDFVKVLDFGLVTDQRAPGAGDLRLTLPEQAIGTPEFMPPEVVLGHEVDGRADLYGLGCVAYWLLTGRPVFEGGGYYEVISKHLQVPPDPPSRHSPHAIPPALEAVILRCLEKEPERRPADARVLAHELRSISFANPWNDERALAWWAERPELAGAPGA
jgi:serine/threonine-protein kinase